MKEFIRLCVITGAVMAIISAAIQLSVALGQGHSPWDAILSLGLAAGALGLVGLIGLLDTDPPKRLAAR